MNQSELSSISASASDGTTYDVFAPSSSTSAQWPADLTYQATTDGRIYDINYSGGNGQDVAVRMVTARSVGGFDCVVTGFAIGG